MRTSASLARSCWVRLLCSSVIAFTSFPQLGIEGVAQGVAEEVEGEGGAERLAAFQALEELASE